MVVAVATGIVVVQVFDHQPARWETMLCLQYSQSNEKLGRVISFVGVMYTCTLKMGTLWVDDDLLTRERISFSCHVEQGRVTMTTVSNAKRKLHGMLLTVRMLTSIFVSLIRHQQHEVFGYLQDSRHFRSREKILDVRSVGSALYSERSRKQHGNLWYKYS